MTVLHHVVEMLLPLRKEDGGSRSVALAARSGPSLQRPQFVFVLVPSRGLALVHLANRDTIAQTDLRHPGAGRFPGADLFAMTELLGLSVLELPVFPGDDHEPSVYVGRYRLDNGNTVSIRFEDGALLLSSPSCELVPLGPGAFQCDAAEAWFIFDDDIAPPKYFILSDHWVARPESSGT